MFKIGRDKQGNSDLDPPCDAIVSLDVEMQAQCIRQWEHKLIIVLVDSGPIRDKLTHLASLGIPSDWIEISYLHDLPFKKP